MSAKRLHFNLRPDGGGRRKDGDRSDSDETPQRDHLPELLTFLLPFAQAMLAQNGSFLPFGAGVTPEGKMTATPRLDEQASPHAESVLSALFSDLALQASSGRISAAGICTDVRVSLPGDSHPSDAICLELEDHSGEAIEIFVPYELGGEAPPRFGEAVIHRIEPSIFVARGD